jgi:hypothetical protein
VLHSPPLRVESGREVDSWYYPETLQYEGQYHKSSSAEHGNDHAPLILKACYPRFMVREFVDAIARKVYHLR